MKLRKKKLKNGITVVMEKRDLPVVSLSISNKFGGAYEKSKIKGVAHVIEHVLFTGTKTRTQEEISREIENKGGLLNAFTNHDVTSYWFKLPSKHLFTGLNILIDMLNNPKFDHKKFEKEKKVILEEIKMCHDNPHVAVHEEIEKNLFKKPFGELIIGSKETVSALDRDHVANLFEKMYSPENFIVTIVGKADFEKVCKHLEKNFKKKNKKPAPVKIKKKNAKTVEKRPGIDQAHFILAMHAPLANTKEYHTLQVLNAYLATGMSSRLFLEIREKRGLAYVISGSINSEKNYSYYSIYVGTTKQSIPKVKKLILEEFKKANKMTEKALGESKEKIIGFRKVSQEESSDVMNGLMYYELVTKAEDYYDYEKKINVVTLKDVKNLSNKLIKNYSTAAIVPK